MDDASVKDLVQSGFVAQMVFNIQLANNKIFNHKNHREHRAKKKTTDALQLSVGHLSQVS